MKEMLQELLKIAKALNGQGIVPTLLGSLGLSLLTGKDWQPSDIDIHVPGDPRGWEAPDESRIYDWEKIYSVMTELGYELIDLHEHEFKQDFCIQFGTVDELPTFAGIQVKDLDLKEQQSARFYLPSAEQFLKIYNASSRDSYRANNTNAKDLKKIEFLRSLLNGGGEA